MHLEPVVYPLSEELFSFRGHFLHDVCIFMKFNLFQSIMRFHYILGNFNLEETHFAFHVLLF